MQEIDRYVAAVTKVQFHFQFLRSPDAAFGGLIGWLFKWKCKFSCRIISNIANYLKYNYFWDGDGIDNVTLRLWKFAEFCSRHTVGVAGDDIMLQILVTSIISKSHHTIPQKSDFWLIRIYHTLKYVCFCTATWSQRVMNESLVQFIPRNMHTVPGLLCLLWLYIDWFSHIHKAYFTGTVAI